MKDKDFKQGAVKIWLALQMNPDDEQAQADAKEADELMVKRNIAKRLRSHAKLQANSHLDEAQRLKKLSKEQIAADEPAKALATLKTARALSPGDEEIEVLIAQAQRLLEKDLLRRQGEAEMSAKSYPEARHTATTTILG